MRTLSGSGNSAASIKSSYGYATGNIVADGLTSGLSGISVEYGANGKVTYRGAADYRRNGGASGY